MSEPRTDEIESGSWPTAKASDGRTKDTGGSADRGLDAMARAGLMNWPTATDAKASGAAGYSTASGRHSGTTLTDATVGPRGPAKRSTTGKNRAWFTPHGMGNEGNPRRNGPSGNELGRQVGQQGVKGRLNHRWVAQLMNFPADWLD